MLQLGWKCIIYLPLGVSGQAIMCVVFYVFFLMEGLALTAKWGNGIGGGGG